MQYFIACLNHHYLIEQNSESMDTMESEGVPPEQSESELPRDVSVTKEDETIRMEDSDGEEDVLEDIGALSSGDEDFYVGKKKPISSKGRPRKKTQQAAGAFPEPQVHHVREKCLKLLLTKQEVCMGEF